MQAVEHLLRAGASVFGLETGGTVLFHPKVYLLQGESRVWLSIGSSNLTCDGLYRNFEANSMTTCGVEDPDDQNAIRELLETLGDLRRIEGLSHSIRSADLVSLVSSGALIDETRTPLAQRVSPTRHVRRSKGSVMHVHIPAAPPPHPDLGTVRRVVSRSAGQAVPAVAAASPSQPRYFAMTLSAFDTSHRRGVGGTPEISLPEESVAFFPAVRIQGRRYPDAYFNALLNQRSGTALPVLYRIWHRPPGSGTGHTDWRINVGHDTIDQTRAAGGDVLLVERLPDGSDPGYEVWVVHPSDPEHARLLARCTETVQSRGSAGLKQYGLF